MDNPNPYQLTLGNLLLANAIMMAPVYIMAGRGLWYLAQMAGKVEQMWQWYNATQIRRGQPAVMSARYGSGE